MTEHSNPLKNARHERFCHEMTVDQNASAAYVRAGYSPKGANASASKLLTNPSIAGRIKYLEAKVIERIDMDADAIVERYKEIALADPNELMQLRRGACRYCYGKDNEYQWRTPNELQRSVEAYFLMSETKQELIKCPTDLGGFGFSRHKPPHPACPECDGDGEIYTKFNDTRGLTPGGRALYAGVKQTQHGLEVKTHDQMAALTNLARHAGLFEKEQDRNHRLGSFEDRLLKEIRGRGSKAIVRDPVDRAKDAEEGGKA
jgi:phage terminase small subunit